MTKKTTISLLAILAAGNLYAGHSWSDHHKRAHDTAHKYHSKAHKTAHRYHDTAHNAAMSFLNGSDSDQSAGSGRHGVGVHVGGWHGEASAGNGSVSAGAGHSSSSDNSIGVDTSIGGMSFGF